LGFNNIDWDDHGGDDADGGGGDEAGDNADAIDDADDHTSDNDGGDGVEDHVPGEDGDNIGGSAVDGDDAKGPSSSGSSSSSSSSSSTSSSSSSSSDDGKEEDEVESVHTSLRQRFDKDPHKLNHDWGPFKFTMKKGAKKRCGGQGTLSWQARCPFHKHDHSVLCKKSISTGVTEVTTGNFEKVDGVLRALKHWCVVACDYDRRWKHHDFPTCADDAPPEEVLIEMCPQEAPEATAVIADVEFDDYDVEPDFPELGELDG
jgi:hypothetical protein